MGGDRIYGPFNLIMDLESLPYLEGNEHVEALKRIEAWLRKYSRCRYVKEIEAWLMKEKKERARKIIEIDKKTLRKIE